MVTPDVPAPASKRWTRRCLAAAAVIAVLSFAGGAAGMVVIRGERHVTSSAPTTSSTTALQRWWSSARDDFTDLKDASDEAQLAIDVIRPGALSAACQHVHDAAEVRLQSHLPSPNTELTAELNAAIEDFHAAAHMCLAVVAGSSSNYDSEFLSSMTQANRHMSAAQDIINRMLVSI